MLKKMRCFYWKMRDQGKGGQVKLFAFVICLTLISLVGLVGRSVVISHNMSEKVTEKKGDFQGDNEGASSTTKGAISLDSQEENGAPSGVTSVAPSEIKVDTSGLDTFLGFMSEDAYKNLVQQVTLECQKRQCTSAKKLNYQQTKDGSFDVTSFVLLSDGSIQECGYNLKSMAVTMKPTTYSEADIQNMSEQEKLAEEKALKEQQKADQKKADKKKKSKSKKAQSKKKKSGKKTKTSKKK